MGSGSRRRRPSTPSPESADRQRQAQLGEERQLASGIAGAGLGHQGEHDLVVAGVDGRANQLPEPGLLGVEQAAEVVCELLLCQKQLADRVTRRAPCPLCGSSPAISPPAGRRPPPPSRRAIEMRSAEGPAAGVIRGTGPGSGPCEGLWSAGETAVCRHFSPSNGGGGIRTLEGPYGP